MSSLTVRRIESRQDIEQFIRAAWNLYAQDPNWVPPLLDELRTRLCSKKNPYFEHAQVAYFLAERDGQCVGRISAQDCELVRRYHGQDTGHFGFFECEESQQTADALFQAAEDWLRQRGLKRMIGPFSLSINDEVGMLVDGFDRAPSVFMGHHRPYYPELVEAAGLQKEMDAYAYMMDVTLPFPDRVQHILKRAGRNADIQLRSISRRQFTSELNRLLEMFNEAWVENWGYIPFTQAEVEHLAHTIRPLIGKDSVLLAEVDGQEAGFMVVLPNLNELIRDLDGKLFPVNWMRLLWRLNFSCCTTARVPLMGITKQFQRSRTGAAIAFSMIERCRQNWVPKGVTHCEMSWILENNEPMRRILEALNSSRDKTYRIYSKSL
jgi:GNAT superfamily N-acetyltransferase